jgi:hypothetical protein
MKLAVACGARSLSVKRYDASAAAWRGSTEASSSSGFAESRGSHTGTWKLSAFTLESFV